MKREIISLCCAFFAAATALSAPADSIKKVSLDEVVVTSIRATSRTPVVHSDLNMRQLQLLSIAGDAPSVLELLPSITLSSESGTGLGATSLRIRGADPSRINVTLNGVQLNDAESQNVFWQNLPDLLLSLGSLQVQRGVGTSTNGVASLGGSINMELMRPTEKPYAAISGELGSYGTAGYSGMTGTGISPAGLSFDAQHSRIISNGYVNRTGIDNTGFTGAAGWQNKKNYVRAFLMYGEQHTGLFGGTPKDKLDNDRRYNPAGEYQTADGVTHYYENEKDNYTQWLGQLTYARILTDKWRLSATLHATLGEGYYEQYKARATLADYGLSIQNIDSATQKKSDIVRQKWLKNAVVGGVATAMYASDKANLNFGAAYQIYDGVHFGNVIWSQYNDGSIPNGYEYYRNTGIKNDANVFAKMSLNVMDNLTLFADVQLRYASLKMSGKDDNYYETGAQQKLDTTYRWLFFNPKIGVYYQMLPEHNVYGSIAISGREPNRSDLKDAVQNGVAKPTEEHLYDLEFGYRFNRKETILSANFFYMYYKNQIVHSGRLNDSYRPIMENVLSSYRRGVELVAATKFFSKLAAEANLTLSQNKIKDFTSQTPYYTATPTYREDYYSKVDIAYSPNIVGSAALRYSFTDKLALSLMGKYVGEQYMDNTQSNDRVIEDYFVCNARLSFDFDVKNIGGVQAQFLVNNVFNTRYSNSGFIYDYGIDPDTGSEYLDTRYCPQAGTNLMLKLTLKF
ncbi:MAG: TonB-dependent receptor plug domain-containing protein [Prevotellaceae bacterium]|jgi:iron complex outermembrane receptor protein|nr:TonB-dependent receptor plug domain-containing protein [Prevotellaceae bacterium]